MAFCGPGSLLPPSPHLHLSLHAQKPPGHRRYIRGYVKPQIKHYIYYDFPTCAYF